MTSEEIRQKDLEIEEVKRMLSGMQSGIENTAQGKYLHKAELLLEEFQNLINSEESGLV